MASKRKVICNETGEIFNTVKDAAKSIGKSEASVRRCCNGSQAKLNGLTWDYYEEPDLVNEIWKDAKCLHRGTLYDFSGKLLVSNMGRIKYVETGSITYGTKNKCGYMRLTFNSLSLGVHRIVATTFIPNPDNRPTVDHINTDRTDNRVINLRWFDYSEQVTDNEYTKQKFDSIKRRVRCIETGEIFESVKDATDAVNLKCTSNISGSCKGTRGMAAGYNWEYVEEDQ